MVHVYFRCDLLVDSPATIDFLFCISIADCGLPPQVERAVIKEYNVVLEGVRLPATLEGVTRYYECQSNTVAEGLISTTCQVNGKWSTTGLYCRRKLAYFIVNINFFHLLVSYESVLKF